MSDHNEDDASQPQAGWALKGLLTFATADATESRRHEPAAVESKVATADAEETTLSSEDGP